MVYVIKNRTTSNVSSEQVQNNFDAQRQSFISHHVVSKSITLSLNLLPSCINSKPKDKVQAEEM